MSILWNWVSNLKGVFFFVSLQFLSLKILKFMFLLVAYAMVANLRSKMDYLSMPLVIFGILIVYVAFIVTNQLPETRFQDHNNTS